MTSARCPPSEASQQPACIRCNVTAALAKQKAPGRVRIDSAIESGGVTIGDIGQAGTDVGSLSSSPTAIIRLKDGWIDEYDAWQKRDLSAKRYLYVWADGIYLQARLEDEK